MAWPAAAGTPLLPAPSARNSEAFAQWLGQLDRDDPRSVHMAVVGARNLLAGTAAATTERRQVWRHLRALQAEVMSRWNRRVRANKSWASALDCRFAGRCLAEGTQLPNLDGMLRALTGYGGWIDRDEDGARMDADLIWLAGQLKEVAPADEVAFARLEGLRQHEPAMQAGVLVVSLETVRHRLANWQAAMQAHAQSPHLPAARRHVASLLNVYLAPTKWTPGATDASRLSADRRASYRRLMAAKPASPHRKVVAKALDALVAAQGDSAALARARDAVDVATEEALALQRHVAAASGKPRQLRQLVKAFSRWAKASDRRLAKLADSLSREDARRLSTYATERLFPQIEALMALIDGRKGKRKAQARQPNLPGGPASGSFREPR